MNRIRDKELYEYQKKVGAEEYRRQYVQLYSEVGNRKKMRFSGRVYKNDPETLNSLKEKYKNGVSINIINEMLGILSDIKKE